MVLQWVPRPLELHRGQIDLELVHAKGRARVHALIGRNFSTDAVGLKLHNPVVFFILPMRRQPVDNIPYMKVMHKL